jgi:hypothetical protein
VAVWAGRFTLSKSAVGSSELIRDELPQRRSCGLFATSLTIADETMMQPLQVGTDDVPMSGGIPYAVGQASMIRIPIPGQRGLCIELSARNFKGTSTSTIFFQDVTGKKNLRLDYGYNKVSKVVDYHWNQKSVFTNFGIADHTTVGKPVGWPMG